jgi:DNA-binding PucR family transcriptional regulator
MLTHTLETYLDLGGDMQRTATRLNLHRTSCTTAWGV